MSLKDIYFKVKKGVRAGIMAAQQYDMKDVEIASIINDFRQSRAYKLMLDGQRYYEVDNDILHRKMTKTIIVDGKEQEVLETYKANNKLAHAKYKNLVDEKVEYLLTSEYTLDCEDDKEYPQIVKETLGKHFQYQLSGLGYEASNKGKGWLHPYLDKEGNFKTLLIPSEQCIPIWTDASHTELSAMIRVYDESKWILNKKEIVTKVEYWTPTSVLYGIFKNNTFINDIESTKAHYVKDKESANWDKVPFVPFKNNRWELPDIKFIKVLLDNYDKARSDVANYIEEVKNLIYVLKGYGGESIDDFMRNLNFNRAILIDDVKDGGVDTLNPTMDITAAKEHFEQLKRDLIEDGQGVNQDLDKLGSAPSGVTLAFFYRGLDLKCNALETEFKMGFEQLLYFVDKYLSETGKGEFTDVNMDIVFTREAEIDETEVIENCGKSGGIISKRTILLNHPWVKDVEKEETQLKKEAAEIEDTFDKIPITNKTTSKPDEGKEPPKEVNNE